jgi:geranylgeranyl reductase family protein
VRSQYDVVIVGAGPAGLVAAEELARSGRSVLLIEKNTEIGPKVCAGGIPTGSTGLDVPGELVDREISSFDAVVRGRTIQIRSSKPFLVTVDRRRLGQRLLRRAQDQGAEFICGSRVTAISSASVGIDGHLIGYRFLVGADGTHSIVRRYVHLHTARIGTTIQYVVSHEVDRMELHFDYQVFGSGFGWVVPHRGYTIIGLGLDLREARGKSLRHICREWCARSGINIEGASEQSWPINYDYRGWKFGNIFLAGDAAGLASGLTGEGIPAAVASGRMVARRIIEPAYRDPRFNQVLARKNRQEALHEFMCLRPKASAFVYRTLIAAARIPCLKRKLLDFLF